MCTKVLWLTGIIYKIVIGLKRPPVLYRLESKVIGIYWVWCALFISFSTMNKPGEIENYFNISRDFVLFKLRWKIMSKGWLNFVSLKNSQPLKAFPIFKVKENKICVRYLPNFLFLWKPYGCHSLWFITSFKCSTRLVWLVCIRNVQFSMTLLHEADVLHGLGWL